jgi:osomolarity two-component system, response regulator SKN7
MRLMVTGMNDVLPKPFTKEGLLHMLEKHLAHLKNKPVGHVDGMAAPQPVQIARQLVLKEEDSPAKSPASVSNWNSPNQVPGISPVGSNVTDEYGQAMPGQPVQHPGAYGMNPMQANMGYPNSAQMSMQARQQQGPPGHRRQISDISGGDDMNNPAKRQQMYPPQMPPQQMGQMQQRPR